ncbi:MAG: HDOD domain-containing protein [Pseudomonadota bacterium]
MMDVALNEELWFGELSDNPEEQQAAQSLVAQVAVIHGLRPFPASAQKLMSIANDPNYTVANVERIIESDPSLAARVLRVVNSAAYSLQTRCTSISHAVVLLGAKALSSIASAMAVLDLFQSKDGPMVLLREHSVSVATLSRHLAFALNCGIPTADLFTCGLLHDLGKLLIFQTEIDGQTGQSEDHYRNLLAKFGGQPDSMHGPEREFLGFDHAVLAGHILHAWKIPDPVPVVVARHHQLKRACKEGGNVGTMVSLVHLADRLSYCVEQLEEPNADQIKALLNVESAAFLGIKGAQLGEIWNGLRAAYRSSRELFTGAG